jgi:hypothetical protein
MQMAEQGKYPINRYLKDPNTHICFVWNSVVKDFFTTDAIFPKRPSGGSNVNIRTNTGG